MTSPLIQEKAVDAITLMNTTVINLRLYPPTSATITQTIDRLHQSLSEILAEEDPLILAESERMLLFGDEPAWTRNQEKAHVRAFLEILINQGIKSISFCGGVEKEELSAFFQTLSRRPDELRAEGGVQQLLNLQEIRNIKIDEKVYLTKNVNPFLAGNFNIKDDVIKFLMEATDLESIHFKQLKEQAKDSAWITGVFDTWMEQFRERQGTAPKDQLANDLVRMAGMLLKIAAPEDAERIIRLLSGAISQMDGEMISLILSLDVESACGEEFFTRVVGELDKGRFAEAFDGLAGLASAPDKQDQKAVLALESLKNTEKGRQLAQEREELAARQKKEREARLAFIREKAQGILRGEEGEFSNEELLSGLRGFVKELYELGDAGTADALIERLIEKLHSKSHEIRSGAADIISHLLDDIIVDGREEKISYLSEKLADWWRAESVYSPVCENICKQLKKLAQSLLEHDPFIEVNHILDILSLTQSGRSPKDRQMTDLASEALRELATDDLLNILFAELRNNEQGKQKEASRNLARLGAKPVERLLDLLRDSEDSDERVRILRIIADIGKPSVPAILSRIALNEPWYVLRNLAYILGRVGGEGQAKEFIPLLLHENDKVQTEALKSLQRVGGKVRAETLLSVLPKADDQFKGQIVELLGVIKAGGAVPALLELLNAKGVMSAALKADLDVKICTALGKIGSTEALADLAEIAKKGFFTARNYPDKVKAAAAKAITAIKQGAA